MTQNFTNNFAYDVFLSFRGEDTRYNFTGNLNKACGIRGIKTFFDDRELKGGDKLSPSLFTAIEKSRMFVIVFSENYASSTWCLDELVKILQCAEQNSRRIWPIFYKVDPSDIRHQRNSFHDAMIKHEKRFGNDSEKMRNWRSALTKVANIKGDHFKIMGNVYECNFIDKIVKEISTRLLPKGLYIGEQVVGLQTRLEDVKSLLDISSSGTVCMLGIYGIGGSGKTTLAKALYNSIVDQFDYASFLFDVREIANKPNGLISLQKILLSSMFEVEDIKLRSIDEGAFLIMNRFRNMRVLLVLDDVDCVKQLEKLAGQYNWFGCGSRIIVTTRNKHLLVVHGIGKTYKMTGLNAHEALELFCWKAFKSSQPPREFEDLSNIIVNYASGLPLALEVIGSNLCGKDLRACVSALGEYKSIPNKNIQGILRISYDDLEDNQKEIFLDIACFFKGNNLKDIKNILDACGFGSDYHIGVLIDKSLITVDGNGDVGMHDLIKYMGREIVREAAPKELGRRSRLWFEEDIIEVLEENSGTNKIEGIILESPQRKIQWEGTAFKKMKKLRILIVKDACFSVGPEYLPNSLRVLEWNEYPLTSLPSNFNPKKLVIWQMPRSSLKLEKPFKNFKYLSMMNFSNCQFITEVPDLSEFLALKTLNLSCCENLIKVHDSVGFLTKVTTLNLVNCKNLISLPSTMQMAFLQELDIRYCTSLEHLPDFSRNMNCLSKILAWNTAIKELPYSIGNLISLRELHVPKSNLISIPESIKELSNLEYLDVDECKNLQGIYELPSNLKTIYAADCASLNLPSLNVIWSQAVKGIPNLDIEMPGEWIPDCFDYCCKGRVLSFWAHQKLPNAAFAFIYSCEEDWIDSQLRLFINGIEVKNNSRIFGYSDYTGCHVYLKDLNEFWGGNRIEGLERYLVQEWNYIEIEVINDSSMIIDECRMYVYKQGTNMENVRFECPCPTLPTELILSNALKRKAALPLENKQPKKLRRKHKPRDLEGKFQNPRAKKRKIYSVKKDDQTLTQNRHNDIDFPCERLWKLHLPSKVIFFLWELCNDVLPTSDFLNSRHVQVPQTCSLCGVENETSQHIFTQCTFARALWFGSNLSMRLDSLEPPDVVYLIRLWLHMGQFDTKIHEQYTYPMALILYTIWYFRNKAIFKGETPSSEVALTVWLGLCQKYFVACPAIDIPDHVRFSSLRFYEVNLVYLSVHRIKKSPGNITYCQAFIFGKSAGNSTRMGAGNFLMSGTATKFQVLFEGLKSLLRHVGRRLDNARFWLPSSSCIAMLKNPSMAPPHLQTILKDVNSLLENEPIQFRCGSFPRSSSVRVKSWGAAGKWRFFLSKRRF